MSEPTSELTGPGQRAKLNAPHIKAAYAVRGEIPQQHLDDAVKLYCRWMIRLYLERRTERDHESELGAA
jgi:hypothetical protein